ncbi:MAG: sulfatase [Bacteroidetes bacterium]|nr:sulfatase [Bacteroidota bacterium]MDA1268878.1 sulfatase [Bacteroidota bacterium]
MKKFLLPLFTCLWTSTQAQETLGTPDLPNLVLIFMDDMGYGDLEVYGGYPQQTPHLTQLAANGMRFTNFYAAQAVCSASRAALLTGCYPNRLSISGALMPWSTVALNPTEETLASLVKKKGYKTGMIGKWHLGAKAPFLPTSYGFDSYFGLPYSNDMWPVGFDGKPITDTANRKFKFPPLYLLEGNEPVIPIQSLEDQAQLTGLYTERAVEFIERNKESPFFLYLAHSMPHVPIAVSEKYKNKSGAGLFGDLMLELDDSVGEVIRALEKNGLTEKTLVIFTSDNGPWLTFGNHAGSSGGLREGKGSAWEGGVRVPCIMSFPGVISAGTVSNNLAATMDILPTMAVLLGVPLPSQKIDGVNILPLLQQVADANPRDHFVYYYDANSLKAIRQGQWKLVFPHTSQTYQGTERGNNGFPGIYNSMQVSLALYNLSTDPGETFDVAQHYPAVVEALTALANEYRKTLGDDLTKQPGNEKRPSAKIN